ncbi:cytochrome b/b6 domain-containing protein [Roseobacter sp. YSTF-M11]|uniref:Cytochrome b/b6 domain-containing protein n=1 Tax=Roseobacter insulae TaxID=2859783 RepID=A0A9X1JXM0_9RHOB|nr:cytochrome b/b6 domain-containing protein [Roseobacter insulae]MBW4707415.1 cytochrome b/b6 domain-containing protein [Roseobacter insulae]
MTAITDKRGRWVKRQTRTTRITHWIWALSVFFLMGSGAQIFNAHPVLYFGDQSGFGFDNTVFSLAGEGRALPGWATIPSGVDLATGRVVHFFFAWVFVVAFLVWCVGAVASGHMWHDLMPRRADLRSLAGDIRQHAQLRFHHRRRYGPLQKLSYGAVLFGLFPLIVATGLAMSPAMNAAFPWLPEILGGRQTARTLHFAAATGVVLFILVHVVMVLLAGPVNEMRSMLTGWYKLDEGE